MRLFETIKETVTVGQAAEYYGMKLGRNNMICCPFHNDHHPSMKLNTTYYYCFGCGATGDVIQFVANLFGLSNYEAAKIARRPSAATLNAIVRHLVPLKHSLCYVSCYAKRE